MRNSLIICALVLGLTSNFLVSFTGMSTVCADSPPKSYQQITSFLEEARAASAAGESKTLVLTLSEEDVARNLTEMVEKKKAGIPVSVKDIQVCFSEGSQQVRVEARVKYLLFTARVSADVLITPEGRHGYYEVVTYSFGNLPGVLVDWVMKKIPYQMSGPLPLGDLPVEVESFFIGGGKLHLKVITVPAK